MCAPLRHRGAELRRIPLGIPASGIRIRPTRTRIRIEVIEDTLHHPAVEQQAFDAQAVPASPGIGWRSVDVERLAGDCDVGCSGHWERSFVYKGTTVRDITIAMLRRSRGKGRYLRRAMVLSQT